MNAILRSRLFRIAMLSFAVLFSQTANAAKPARQLSRGTPPAAIRLCAAWPESRNDFKGTIKKVQRPNPQPAARTLFSTAVFIPAGVVNLRASEQAAFAFNLRQLTYAAPQFRPYALRV